MQRLSVGKQCKHNQANNFLLYFSVKCAASQEKFSENINTE
jgi:hypothetical protein